MAHPSDRRPDGRCRFCGDRLSKVIRRRGNRLAYRRHLRNRTCTTKGRGEPF